MSEAIDVNIPLGRIVQGDPYQGKSANQEGTPYVYKTGAKTGQPYEQYYIGLGIPKTLNVPWEQEGWGQIIMQVAKAANPGSFDPNTGILYQGRPMAYKVVDGDSVIPNDNQKRPCDNIGFPGHWVLSLVNNGYAPKLAMYDASVGKYVEPDQPIIQRGGYVQAKISISPNSSQRPGVYIDCKGLLHVGYGEPIMGGGDVNTMGFTQGALPNYVSQVPVYPQGQAAAPVYPQGQAAAPVYPQGQAAAPVPGNPIVSPQQIPPTPPVQPAIDLVNQVPNVAPLVVTPVQNAPPPVQAVVAQVIPPVVVPPVAVSPSEESYIVEGQVMTRSQILALPGGWTEAHLAGLPRA